MGLLVDMDQQFTTQFADSEEMIMEKGEKIMGGFARSRDRTLALGCIVRQGVVYRTSNCAWDMENYRKLDDVFTKLAKKATQNMQSFPTRLLYSLRKHGGLGIPSLSMAAQEAKRKQLLNQINDKSMTGVHQQGILGRALRLAGQGGSGEVAVQVWDRTSETTDKPVRLSSVIEMLGEIGLMIRTGNMVRRDGRDCLAVSMKEDHGSRDDRCIRGIVMKGEEEEDGKVWLRVGQCWKEGNNVLEIVGFDGDRVETMLWEGEGELKVGSVVEVSTRNDCEAFPTGMGSRFCRPRCEVVAMAKEIVELGIDCAKKGHLKSVVGAIRRASIDSELLEEVEWARDDWAEWEGGHFDRIYTDGSYDKSTSLKEMLLGKGEVKAGGAVVLSNGEWFYNIEVEMDVEVESAFDTELISILIACEIAKRRRNGVRIFSDCNSAIKVGNGGPCARWLNTLN